MNQSHVFITGADRGLGFALTKNFLEKGYRVIAGRNMPEVNQLDALAEHYEGRLLSVSLDVTSDQSSAEAAEVISTYTSALDIIINNAGIVGDTTATVHDPLPFDNMMQVYNVNALGPLRVSHALMPLLLAGKTKRIVNISSEAGSIAATSRTSWYGYCMSKAALNMQSAVLHNDLKQHGGQVLILHPGWVKTYMSGVLSEVGDLTADQSAAYLAELIVKATPEPAEKPIFIDYSGEVWPW
ncbi:SDR family oxidoreductase [Paenibacillus solisilvae]|uniref:SDR family oxidoreductase n=1 Tax=Paenibacillus solisilvae TaxID=2486751 RepID=A0ABW0W177_9BACL